jgi:hypothetical protein
MPSPISSYSISSTILISLLLVAPFRFQNHSMSHSSRVERTSSAGEDYKTVETSAAAAAAGLGSPYSQSSLTMANQVLVDEKVPNLYEYWKSLMVTEGDISKFHATGWITSDLVCLTTTLDFPMIDRTNIVYFESHLMCSLGHPPSKFLVAILNYLGCELIHFHPNVISTLSCFSMLCEC